MSPPPVTIIIPAYNYATYLGEALRSALSQDYAGAVEVLVVDDGSTDDTPSVAGSFGARIRYHRKENGGLSAARNTGMELASHDLVAFLDADDVLEPDAVRKMVNARVSRQIPPLVTGGAGRMMDSSGGWIGEARQGCGGCEEFTTRDFVLRNRFAPIVLADRRALMALGGFDPQLKASEDRDMWIRAAAMGKVVKLDECLYRKRDHGGNMSRHATRQTESIMQVMGKARRNPAIALPDRVWREAEAICLFQSARMHLSAGDRMTALRQCVRSLAVAPWLQYAGAAGFPVLFRIRFLALQLAALARIRRESAGGSGGAAARDTNSTIPNA